ncbi:uncharacterized protein LOC133182831 [Saccostrea echinata]|uniref:uncharacterized protein LOC133182831 n=1 Tax=Saccostrea echinata TaxID=191078 RepID=UPI002A7F783C|nr:uncharacterized protein LOC133182831 [Saccostrea echinata]
MHNLMGIIQQIQKEIRGDMKRLRKDIEENFNTTQQHFSNVSDKVRFHTNIEIDSMKSFVHEKVFYISVVFVMVLIMIVFRCFCKRPSKNLQQAPLRDDAKKLSYFENNVAVVSFSEHNANLHLKIAKSVTEDFKCNQIILGGVRNLSGLQLTSKVCFVFVDKNERNIILETDNDVSQTKSDFVQSIIKQGNTQVLVIYCQHENSNNLTRLCYPNLGNVQNHKTLSQLRKQNCVLSIESEFSAYQKDYLRIFLNETLT